MERITNIVVSMLITFSIIVIFSLPGSQQVEPYIVSDTNQPANVSPEQVKCLATGIYYEAGYEPQLGQIAVARVIMNRVMHGFGSNPCKVVYQSNTVPDGEDSDGTRKLCQFSWACDDSLKSPFNSQRYHDAEKIAVAVLTKDQWNDTIPNNVLYFHSTNVNPKWKLHKYIVIGNHVFYSQGREKIIKQQK